MNRKFIAVMFLLAVPLLLSYASTAPIAQYSYLFAQAGASDEFIAGWEIAALAAGLAFGVPGMAFAVTYGLTCIA